MHGYISNGYLNSISNFNYKKAEKITSLGPLLDIVKVGMHYYLWNVHLNLWLNFNSKKLVKSEIPLCSFAKVGVKGGESGSKCHKSCSACLSIKKASKSMSCIFARVGLKGVPIARKIPKVGVHIFISNGHPNLWSNLISEKLVRSETSSCIFARVGLKGVQIAWNIPKVQFL